MPEENGANGITDRNLHYIPQWIKDNEKFFLPPICNKMMHGEGQLKIFYVGGPNQRKDFHLEEGEEFFYMVKGDMNLITMEMGKFRDVHIKEGEVFLLPGRIPHSPQRVGNTIGLVIERERFPEERDGLRYFVGDTTETLYEKWFYCSDLGTELGPLISEYFASEQHRTGKPIPGTITENPPFHPDPKRKLQEPFLLSTWLKKHGEEIDSKGQKHLFDPTINQSDVVVFGAGKTPVNYSEDEETWLWQLEGTCEAVINGKSAHLSNDQSLLIPAGSEFYHSRGKGSITLSVVMNPKNKHRANF